MPDSTYQCESKLSKILWWNDQKRFSSFAASPHLSVLQSAGTEKTRWNFVQWLPGWPCAKEMQHLRPQLQIPKGDLKMKDMMRRPKNQKKKHPSFCSQNRYTIFLLFACDFTVSPSELWKRKSWMTSCCPGTIRTTGTPGNQKMAAGNLSLCYYLIFTWYICATYFVM